MARLPGLQAEVRSAMYCPSNDKSNPRVTTSNRHSQRLQVQLFCGCEIMFGSHCLYQTLCRMHTTEDGRQYFIMMLHN